MKSAIVIIIICIASIPGFSQNDQLLKPSETDVLVNVTVTNFQFKVRPNDLIIFESLKSKKMFSGRTDSEGKFSILLPKGAKYKIMYKSYTDSTDYSEFELPGSEGLFTSQLSVQIEPARVFTLENVFFDVNLATLKPASYTTLNDLADLMKLKPSLIIEISGHTDDTGTSDFNSKLSQGRAEAVRNYLIQKGVTANRITAKGYGDTLPVADNSTDEGKAKNRRTEVKIIKE